MIEALLSTQPKAAQVVFIFESEMDKENERG